MGMKQVLVMMVAVVLIGCSNGTLFTADLSKFVNAAKRIDTWKLFLPLIFIGAIVLWQLIERVLVEKCPHCKYPVGRPSKSEFSARKFSDTNCPNCGRDL